MDSAPQLMIIAVLAGALVAALVGVYLLWDVQDRAQASVTQNAEASVADVEPAVFEPAVSRRGVDHDD